VQGQSPEEGCQVVVSKNWFRCPCALLRHLQIAMTLNDSHYLTLNISETVRDTNMFYNEILIGTYAILRRVISNDLDWLSKIFNDTKISRSRYYSSNETRPLCDSWASCLGLLCCHLVVDANSRKCSSNVRLRIWELALLAQVDIQLRVFRHVVKTKYRNFGTSLIRLHRLEKLCISIFFVDWAILGFAWLY